MKITLLGYGAMGKGIKQSAEKRGHEIISICDPESPDATHKKVSHKALKETDVAIDFSHPEAVLENIQSCSEAGVSLVEGTTGWYNKLNEAKSVIKKSDTGFLWSANFSIGVNLYFKIVEHAARMVNNYDEYDIWGHEIHHKNKVDSPSGTAKKLADIIIKNVDRKEKLQEETLHRKINPEELHFTSTRAGEVNFSHTISLDSESDTIRLEHSARNRDGYCLGAVKAAEWIQGKKGFYEMEDFLNSYNNTN